MGNTHHQQETQETVAARPAESRSRLAWRSMAAEIKSLTFWSLSIAASILYAGLAAWLVPFYSASKVAFTILTLIPAIGLLSLPIIIWAVKLFTIKPTGRLPHTHQLNA